jgi:hypothetical protein
MLTVLLLFSATRFRYAFPKYQYSVHGRQMVEASNKSIVVSAPCLFVASLQNMSRILRSKVPACCPGEEFSSFFGREEDGIDRWVVSNR